jgi:hypothetical protein
MQGMGRESPVPGEEWASWPPGAGFRFRVREGVVGVPDRLPETEARPSYPGVTELGALGCFRTPELSHSGRCHAAGQCDVGGKGGGAIPFISFLWLGEDSRFKPQASSFKCLGGTASVPVKGHGHHALWPGSTAFHVAYRSRSVPRSGHGQAGVNFCVKLQHELESWSGYGIGSALGKSNGIRPWCLRCEACQKERRFRRWSPELQQCATFARSRKSQGACTFAAPARLGPPAELRMQGTEASLLRFSASYP